MTYEHVPITYYELEPGGNVASPASRGEAVWFVWAGTAVLAIKGETLPIPTRGVAFVSPGEAPTVMNRGSALARLIRCEAMAL